jgi:hypothetical protein
MKHNFILRIAFTPGVYALLLAAPSVSRADVVFSNFGPGSTYDGGLGNVVGNDGIGNAGEADIFTSALTEKLGSIDVALTCGLGPCDGSTTVSLDNNTGGLPGAAIERFTIANVTLGTLGSSNNTPVVLTSVFQPILTANTPYWITVTGDSGNVVDWNLNITGDGSPEVYSADGGATWGSFGFTPNAYQVNGNVAVPEPSSVPMLVLSLGVVGLLIRRLGKTGC